MKYIYSTSGFIVMSTERGLFLWTPWSVGHQFRSLLDNELWLYLP